MSQPATVESRSSHLSRHFEQLLQQGDSEQFLSEVAAHCSSCTESPWDVLAVVDQLYRRRKLSPQVFRLARISIERRALGFHEAAGRRIDSPAPAAPPGPSAAAAHADSELQRLRTELARAHVEAAAIRQRAQQLEQELEQQPEQQPEQLPVQPPEQRVAQPARPPLQRNLAQQRKAGIPRLWLIGAACAIATLAATLFTMSNPGVQRGRAGLPALAAADPVVQTAASAAVPVAVQPGELSFEQDRYVVSPADTQVVIGIRRTAGTDGEVELEWRATSGGARAGRDFALPAAPATLTLKSGEDAAQLTIRILRNPDRKHTEFFDIRLVRGTGGAALGAHKRVTVFILPGAGSGRVPSGRRAGR